MKFERAIELLKSRKCDRIQSSSAFWYMEFEHVTEEKVPVDTYLRLTKATDWVCTKKRTNWVEVDEDGSIKQA